MTFFFDVGEENGDRKKDKRIFIALLSPSFMLILLFEVVESNIGKHARICHLLD
jgi:hypothetical protein